MLKSNHDHSELGVTNQMKSMWATRNFTERRPTRVVTPLISSLGSSSTDSTHNTHIRLSRIEYSSARQLQTSAEVPRW